MVSDNNPFKGGQLMSIHGFVTRDGVSKQVPLLFVLMSRRRCEDYTAVLRRLSEVLGEVAVEGFVMDFEAGKYFKLTLEN